MMNEIENKVLEIFNKMDIIMDNRTQSIKSALVLVDEILQELPTDFIGTQKGETIIVNNNRYDFWESVKHELKLELEKNNNN